LYSKLKLHYFPILQPGHFRAYSTKIADKKSLMDTNITILALQKKKKIIMDSVNVQIYKIDIGKLIFVKKKY
jgi:hypothetical protein